jgi:hypothetical protein
MSSHPHAMTDGALDSRRDRRVSTETKASVKTTEPIVYVLGVLGVLGVLMASAIVDASDFGAQEAWFYITLLTIGSMVSRSLAKAAAATTTTTATGNSFDERQLGRPGWRLSRRSTQTEA